jgi:hypothetical protein
MVVPSQTVLIMVKALTAPTSSCLLFILFRQRILWHCIVQIDIILSFLDTQPLD